MSIRKYAKSIGFEVVGKLKRLPDTQCSNSKKRYPIWIDQAGNTYIGNYKRKDDYCIIDADGGVR